MSNPPPTRRPPSNAPPAMPAPTFTPRRRFNRRFWRSVLIIALFALLLSPFAVIWRNSRRQAAHDETVGLLISHMQLEQQDSLKLDTWQAGLSADGCNYVLMSFRENNQYVKDFLGTLPVQVSALAMFIDNRTGTNPHTIDFTNARLHFVGNHVREVPNQFQILDAMTAPTRAAAMEAFAPKFEVLPEKLIWGKLLFIPPDTDLRTLLAVTVKIDGQPTILEGAYVTAAQKQLLEHGIYAPPIAAPPSTSSTTQPAQ